MPDEQLNKIVMRTEAESKLEYLKAYTIHALRFANNDYNQAYADGMKRACEIMGLEVSVCKTNA